ncbi:hypothetical protein P280DRAFT_409685 [Massarina eburnea CBS 473.64]|uniref:Uncharacterized protein n=1 Tax=Massarina eburnea CBS 473.64 TaxID=1395130 RepID=A0A6A6RQQ3_9PLEO|nr:hypothetical protein P280DRAFT_409685 [Massarina eburnea CBS 473.64]
MAAPATKTIKDLNGKWLMNRKLSDPSDPILTLQGISWFTRKAVNLATVTQHTKQYTADEQDGVPHIDVDQTATGGIKGTSEHRTLDWTPRLHSDWLFGDLMGQSRFNTIKSILEESKEKGESAEADVKYLTEGWLPESLDGDVFEGFVDNEKSHWTAWAIWGFADIEGERRLVRKFAFNRKDKAEKLHSRLVYEWLGEE